MPRIRHLKRDLTYEELFPDSTSTWPKPSDEGDVGEVVQTGHTEVSDVSQPSGWWSNDNIISSMDDASLRAAYHRYKQLAEQCQQEITRRVVSGVKVKSRAVFDVSTGSRRFVVVEQPRRTSGVGRVAKNTRRRNATQVLAPEQMLKAIEMLIKLKEAKRDTHST